jgi:hypothetical protein
MTSSILVEDVLYVPCKSAAKTAGLGAGYIARLCKKGAVRGKKMGRAWYVNDQSLKDFLVSHSHEKERWYQELAQERREEHRRAQSLTRGHHAITAIAPPQLWQPHMRGRFEQAFARNAPTITQAAGAGHLSVVSPALELLHKFTALVVALMLVVGAYALLDPRFRTFTATSIPETAAAAATVPSTFRNALLDLVHDLSSLFPGRASVSAVVAPTNPPLRP